MEGRAGMVGADDSVEKDTAPLGADDEATGAGQQSAGAGGQTTAASPDAAGPELETREMASTGPELRLPPHPRDGVETSGGASTAPPAVPESASRSWLPWALLGVVTVALVVVVLVVVFASGGDETTTASVQDRYQDEVTTTLQPVVSANRRLSSSLEELNLRTNRTRRQRLRVRQAQAATLTARGGLRALDAPAGAEQIATNARGTLARETAYLAGVAATLADPSRTAAGQAQTLASNLTDALNTVSPPGSDWATSVYGVDRLVAWAPKAARRNATDDSGGSGGGGGGGGTTTTPPASSTNCGDGIVAGPNTTCPFARNVRDAYYDAPGSSATVEVYSPVTDRTYTMSCAPAGSGVTCSGGNNASVTFP